MTVFAIEPALDAVERRAVDLFFGYDVLDPDTSLGELPAVLFGTAPLQEFCQRVLFVGDNRRLLVRESPGDGGWIAVLPGDATRGEVRATCFRIQWDNYSGLKGVRDLARTILLALEDSGSAPIMQPDEAPFSSGLVSTAAGG